MFFINVIDAILLSQTNIKKFLFEDLMGVSSKTANKYLTASVQIKSRQFTQFKNSFKYLSERAGNPMANMLGKVMLGAFEAVESNSEITMPGIKYGCEYSIKNSCEEYAGDNANLNLQAHSLHYSFCFIDAATLPRRKMSNRPTDWSTILGAFPYNAIYESDSYYCLDISDNPEFDPAEDARFNSVFKESILAVMAAMYLDIDRQCLLLGIDTAIHLEFVEQAWNKENTAAFFFEFWREVSEFNTHEEFYKDLSINFQDMDLESVKTNFKRWCKTGSLKDEQWLKLAGVENEINEKYIYLRFLYVWAVILKEAKHFGKLSDPGYCFDDFHEDLIRWCEVIKKELPLDSWQPFKAAS